MEDTIVISDEEDGAMGRLADSPHCDDIIDLTSNHCAQRDESELDSSVIDLTANEDALGSSPSSSYTDGLISSDSSEDMYRPSSSSSDVIEESEGTSNCSWRTESDTSSNENGELQREPSVSPNCLLDQATRRDECLTYNSNLDVCLDTTSSLQGLSSLPTTASGESCLDYATGPQHINCQPLSDACTISTAEESDPQSSPINKAQLYKLRYFKKPPVCHYFHRLEKTERSRHIMPIPLSRMSIVNNTREECIHQGTLHFLSAFVTAEHYPPKDIIVHVIRSILLGAEEQQLKHEAYMILMKMQKLHPATVKTVAWNWSLLCEVMERKENHTYHLFLQYVVQTLDDDFHIHLQRRSFQKSLCKAMLSCNTANIKNVIAWLIHAVENACDIPVNGELNTYLECEQRAVYLLQRMLSIAVEVDNLPVINSNRIADLLFPYVIVLKTRQQRELFFSSTENHLLQVKILELIFLNSCESVPHQYQPLSLSKILHFIGNSTLLLENQGPEWQRWDEILHHICLLFLGLQRITAEHLRTPITERTDEILLRPHMELPSSDDVTQGDIENALLLFWRRTSLGSDVPADLQHRCFMLESMLLTAVQRQIP